MMPIEPYSRRWMLGIARRLFAVAWMLMRGRRNEAIEELARIQARLKGYDR